MNKKEEKNKNIKICYCAVYYMAWMYISKIMAHRLAIVRVECSDFVSSMGVCARERIKMMSSTMILCTLLYCTR